MLKTRTTDRELARKNGMEANMPKFRQILEGKRVEDDLRIRGMINYLIGKMIETDLHNKNIRLK